MAGEAPVATLLNCVSKPQWAHLEFTWRIEDFWELRALASIEALDDENGDVLWSARFGDVHKGIWSLKVYPFGDASAAGRGHVSVFLAFDYATSASLPGGKAKVYAIFSCAALDAGGAKIQGSGRSFTRQKFAEGSASWGWSQFIKNEGDDLQSLLADGHTLTLRVSIDLFLGTRVIGRKNEELSMTRDVQRFLEDSASRDIRLRCRQQVITANRAILAARSNVLRPLLYGGGLENSAPPPWGSPAAAASPSNAAAAADFGAVRALNAWELEISHEDLPVPALENLCLFCATDSCPPLQAAMPAIAELLELLMAACILDVPSLTSQVTSRLIERVCSRADAALILAVAEKFQCDDLALQARKFLQFCAPELTGTELLQMLVPNKLQPQSKSESFRA